MYTVIFEGIQSFSAMKLVLTWKLEIWRVALNFQITKIFHWTQNRTEQNMKIMWSYTPSQDVFAH